MPKKGKTKGKKGKGKNGKGEAKPKKVVDPNKWREQFKKAEEDYKRQEHKRELAQAGAAEHLNHKADPAKDIYNDSDDGLDDSLEFTEEHHHENHVSGLTHMKSSELLGRSFNQYSKQFNMGSFGKKMRRFDKSLITQGRSDAGEAVIPEEWNHSSFVLHPDHNLGQVEGEDSVVVSDWNIYGHPSQRIIPKPKTPTPPPTPPTPPRNLLDDEREVAMIKECKALVNKKHRKKRTMGLMGKLRKHVRQDSKLNEAMLKNILNQKLYTDEEQELAYIMNLLPKFQIFKDLNIKRRFWIAQEATSMHFNPGQMITEEGEHGKYVFFIVKGTVHVRMRVTTMEKQMDKKNSPFAVGEEEFDPNKWEKYTGNNMYTVGKYVEVKTIGKWQMFGEDVMFRDTYLLSVSAVTDCHVMAIDRMKILDHLDLSTKIMLSQRSEINMRIRDQHEGVLRREFARARIVPTDFKLYVEEGGDPINHMGKPSVMYKQANIGHVADPPQVPINRNIDNKDIFNNTLSSKDKQVKAAPDTNSLKPPSGANNAGHQLKVQREWKQNRSPAHPTLSQNIVSSQGAKAAMLANSKRLQHGPAISHRSHGSNESGTEGNVSEVQRIANRLDRKAHAREEPIYSRLGVAKQRQMRKSTSQPVLKPGYVPGGKPKRAPFRRPLYRSKNPFDRYSDLVAASKKKKHITLESDSDWLARMVANDKYNNKSPSSQSSPTNEESLGATTTLGNEAFHPFPARAPDQFHFSKSVANGGPGEEGDSLDQFANNGNMGFPEAVVVSSNARNVAKGVQGKKPLPQYRSSPGGATTTSAIRKAAYDQIIVTYPRDWFKANAHHLHTNGNSINAQAEKIVANALQAQERPRELPRGSHIDISSTQNVF